MRRADEHRYRDMRYRRRGASGQPLPPISLGLWHNFGVSSPIDDAVVRRALDLGVTSARPGRDRSPVWAVTRQNGDRLCAARLACHPSALVGVRGVAQPEERLTASSCLEYSEEELAEIDGRACHAEFAVGVVDGLH